MRESQYQVDLIETLRDLFPGCIVLKNDSSYLQGIPDLLILWHDKWAMLEVKASAESPSQPNQEYYVSLLGSMSYASFVYPEIEEEVLDGLQQALRPSRKARLPQR